MSRPNPEGVVASAPRRSAPWLAASLALAVLWGLATGYALLFRDDALARLLVSQQAMRDAYEARIAELHDRIDRGRGERDGGDPALAARLTAALERQAELERRHVALSGIADPDATGTLPDPGYDLRPAELVTPLPASPGRRATRAVGDALIRLEARLDRLRAAQGEGLGRLAARAGAEAVRLRGVIGATGLDPARLDPPGAPDRRVGPLPGLGGPLVPLDAGGFDGNLALARRALGDGRRLRGLADALPLRAPIRGSLAVTSPFGPRLDPFTRGLALHTGLDLRAETGEPARAAAAGIVVSAERAGGYGNRVEIDHGHGVTTRFGHLARIDVRPGQRVLAGDPVGLVGSTGRSTGAHLHYETRIDGEPADPQRFLDAGRRLAAGPAAE